jgi:hypothetical protein
MAISKTASLRGISECKVAAVTADSAVAYTKGALFDVPIRSLTITENYETLELKQDDQVQEVGSILQSADITGIIAKVPLDVLNILTGGGIAAGGSGILETQVYILDQNSVAGYFFLEIVSAKAGSDAADVADVHIRFKKCRVQSLEYTIDNGFATIKFAAKAIRTISGGQLKSVVFNETSTAIS